MCGSGVTWWRSALGAKQLGDPLHGESGGLGRAARGPAGRRSAALDELSAEGHVPLVLRRLVLLAWPSVELRRVVEHEVFRGALGDAALELGFDRDDRRSKARTVAGHLQLGEQRELLCCRRVGLRREKRPSKPRRERLCARQGASWPRGRAWLSVASRAFERTGICRDNVRQRPLSPPLSLGRGSRTAKDRNNIPCSFTASTIPDLLPHINVMAGVTGQATA